MTIGAWIGAGVGLATLLITILTITVKVTRSFTKSFTTLDATMKSLAEKITDIGCENRREHEEFKGKIEEHGVALAGHETRLQLIEQKPKRGKANA